MDLISVLKSLKIDFKLPGEHHHAHGSWGNLDCPYCSKNSKRYRMGIHLPTGRVNCWTCGGHSLVESLSLASKTSYGEVKALLGNFRFQRLYEPKKQGTLKLPKGRTELLKAHKTYLTDRGIDPDEVQALWKIQGIGIAHRLQWRLFIPVYIDGEMVSWTTRSISNEAIIRYVSAPTEEESVSLKDTLYGIDLARSAVIVCEGPIDCWRIGPGAVATFGTAYTKSQLNLISKFPRRVICFDNEILAQIEALKIVSALSALPGETINVTLEAKDPGEASEEELRELRKLL